MSSSTSPLEYPPHELSLHDLGWRPSDAAGIELPAEPRQRPARVMRQARGLWHVHDGTGELLARARSRRLEPTPVTGDWVLVSGDELGTCLVESVLPRRTVLARAEAGGRSEEQVLAANVDLVAICTPADDVNVRRLERELTAVWGSGATPIVIVTKADLVDDPWQVVSDAGTVCIGVEIVPVSSLMGDGLDAVARLVGPGVTVALIGPSGVGKSSLVNALVGDAVLETKQIRADGKGRHTTTGRYLVPLPSGGLLLDTPGMREFAPWAGDEALAGTFADIEEAGDRLPFQRLPTRDRARLHGAHRRLVGRGRRGSRLVSWRALQELAAVGRAPARRAPDGRGAPPWASITSAPSARP